MSTSQLEPKLEPKLDRDAAMKSVLCVVLSMCGFMYYFWALERCIALYGTKWNTSYYAPGKSQSCTDDKAMPIVAYATLYMWQAIMSLFGFVALCCYPSVRTWARTSAANMTIWYCVLLALGVLGIFILDILTLSRVHNEYDALISEAVGDQKEGLEYELWMNFSLQLFLMFAQTFVYWNSIWDAWWPMPVERAAEEKPTGEAQRLVQEQEAVEAEEEQVDIAVEENNPVFKRLKSLNGRGYTWQHVKDQENADAKNHLARDDTYEYGRGDTFAHVEQQ